MKIFLTYDYELFFGESTGTVEECMLKRTDELFSISREYDIHYTFFVDVGYLIQAEKYSELSNELQSVKNQVKAMIEYGHDVQLHIHPHWEKSTFANGKWNIVTEGAYKLSDFPSHERSRIIHSYKAYLDELIGRETKVFRAGGWCIQPFSDLMDDFKSVGIIADSTVVPGDFRFTEAYDVNFTSTPNKSKYHFEDDVCTEVENGSFIEYPITSMRYSPLFFWKLYAWGRINPEDHKMLGDGLFLSQGGRKKKSLTSFTYNHVSTDGFFASKLNAGLERAMNAGYNEMVTIGHPKSNTRFSLSKLKQFIEAQHTKHSFMTFHEELCK